jgi:hypothetical protein
VTSKGGKLEEAFACFSVECLCDESGCDVLSSIIFKPFTMQTVLSSTEEVLNHHLAALVENDIDEMMKDYAEGSEIWTPDGAISGLEGISSFFSYAFTLLPQGSQVNLQFKIIKDDKAYMMWSAESDKVEIPFATDSFLIRDGKILWQTVAAQIIQK